MKWAFRSTVTSCNSFFILKKVLTSEGSGLGLDIAYRLLLKHKGDIILGQTRVTRRFRVHLPSAI